MKNLLNSMTLRMKLILNAVFMISIMIIITLVSLNSMNNINDELESITERDLPITEKITSVVIAQLEQTALFEKSIRHGSVLNSETTARGKLKESIKNFDHLTLEIKDEIQLIVSSVDDILKSSTTELERSEFTHVKSVIENVSKEHKEFVVYAHETFGLYRENKTHEAEILAQDIEKVKAKMDHEVEALLKEMEKFTLEASKTAAEHEQAAIKFLWILLLFVGVVALVVNWYVISTITQGLGTAVSYLDNITKGTLDEEIHITGNGQDEIGQLLQSTISMQKQLKKRLVDDAEEAKTGTGRLKSALDAVTTNVMIADVNNDIVYMNESLVEMFDNAGDDIRKDLPKFNEKNLMGGNMDQFHKNPAHQQGVIGSLTETINTEIEVGGRTFGLVATPVFKDDGSRLGTAVEWSDRTDAIKAEQEAARLAAENGRVKSALDAVTTNVMVADAGNNIVYMNESLVAMFDAAANDIRKDLPKFDERSLMGGNMDQFHKNPAHQQGLINALKETIKTEIVVGGRTFSLVATPVFDTDGDRLGTAVEWNDRTEEIKAIENEKRIMNEALRVQSALIAVTSNVMVADAGNNIVFMNTALNEMFDVAQNDIRKDLPNFDKSKLIGANMDIFHKNPAHQQRLIEGLTETVKAEIVVGGRTFSLVATPVFNDEGERLGTAVEWSDRTAELMIEKEVEEVVGAAAAGDLGKRLELEGKVGFFRNVSDGINQLAEVCDNVIKDTIRVFGAMAQGNLTETIENDYQGSFAQLKSDANATVDKFIEVIDEIQGTASSVNTGAAEISAGNQSLSQRNEEQASSLEETASSMEEMTSTVRQNADNANQANQLATAARTQAEKGGEVVQNAVIAMGEINTSSKKVADIISVIDEIAFQTNLLALNAAVEAARAGEQGRGFAVVASEVRNLAQRSAGAAKEIKGLIEESVNKVDEGTELVNASGETLDEIVNGIKKVSDIVAEIAAASAEQSSGIDQVNTAITQLDDMTQQNAALVEEAAASSEAMQGQAEGMMELMNFFTTGAEPVVSEVKKKVKVKAKTVRAASGSAAAKPAADDEEWEEF